MKFNKISALVLALGTAGLAQAATFTPGNVVVQVVGDGTAALSSAAAPVSIKEFTTAGTAVQTIALPSTGAGQLTNSGTATSEGLLNLAGNGYSLLVPGYNAAAGTTGVASTTAAAATREAGIVSLNGSYGGVASFGSLLGGNNLRSVASADGVNIYGAGATGIAYTSGGTATQLSSTNTRDLEIAGGQLYFSTGSGTTGIYSLGTGLPTTGTQTSALIAQSASPYAFMFADLSSTVAGFDTLYVADDTANTGGIRKFSKSAAGAWTLNNTLSITGQQLRGLTGVVNGGTVSLFATSQSGLYSFSDASGYNANLVGTANLLATAGTNTVFRGVEMAPVPEPTSGAIALAGLAVAGLVARRRKAD